ncbi:MAG: hypothetical protein Q7U14_16625, partial [Lacisediminimonas sp.]|nr:hypothetical protein [Lacisediminimonas sp.]
SSGDIAITDRITPSGVSAWQATERTRLRVTDVAAINGDLSIVSDAALDVFKASAAGSDNTLTLRSENSDVEIRSLADGGSVTTGAHLVLDAHGSLAIHASQWLDAPKSIEFHTGSAFTLPTTQLVGTSAQARSYTASQLTVTSDDTIEVTSALKINGANAAQDRLSLQSHRDILIDAPISRASGAAIADVDLFADGSNVRVYAARDAVTGLRVITGASGREYQEGTLPADVTSTNYTAQGNYYRDNVGGKYVQNVIRFEVGANNVVTAINEKLLSDNADGSGTLYAIGGVESGGYSVGTALTSAARAQVQVVGKALIDVSAQARAETSLAVKLVNDTSALIRLNQAAVAYNRINIDAAGTAGNVDIVASQALDMDRISIDATGTASLRTTSGAISNQTQVLQAKNLVVNTASTIDLRTDVQTASLNSTLLGAANGSGMALDNSGDLRLTASLASGSIEVTAGGTLTVDDARFTSDVNGNQMLFVAGAGGILVDRIDARTQGDITLRTAGFVTEVTADDSSDLLVDLDIIGRDFTANARNPAGNLASTNLEFNVSGDAIIGAQQSLIITSHVGDLEVSGYYLQGVSISGVTGTVT